jgi:hypothetical protein
MSGNTHAALDGLTSIPHVPPKCHLTVHFDSLWRARTEPSSEMNIEFTGGRDAAEVFWGLTLSRRRTGSAGLGMRHTEFLCQGRDVGAWWLRLR